MWSQGAGADTDTPRTGGPDSGPNNRAQRPLRDLGKMRAIQGLGKLILHKIVAVGYGKRFQFEYMFSNPTEYCRLIWYYARESSYLQSILSLPLGNIECP
jgi:hypothetical protein